MSRDWCAMRLWYVGFIISTVLEAGWKFSMATSMCILSLRPSGLTEPGSLVAPFVYANGNVNSDQSDSVFSARPIRVYERDASGGI